jgi:Reverse transcriptase (RNA-dependent DNA polymerase)
LSDIFAATDKQCVTLLGLLDLSAAFDCVDHVILLDRLKSVFGLDGCALDWLTSVLEARTQQVCYNGCSSAIIRLLYGVPQGSVLGPLLYLLYTAELIDLIAKCGTTAHSYADDTQVYVCTPATDVPAAVERFRSYVEQIERWLQGNRLKMNAEKTRVIWLGTRQQLEKMNVDEIQLSSASIPVSTSVVDLASLH